MPTQDEINAQAAQQEAPSGIGESAQEQLAPKSTVCKERMVELIQQGQQLEDDCQAVLDLVNANPELDVKFCRLFGLQRKSPGGPAR